MLCGQMKIGKQAFLLTDVKFNKFNLRKFLILISIDINIYNVCRCIHLPRVHMHQIFVNMRQATCLKDEVLKFQ